MIHRESALQNADDEGQTSVKKVKRKRPDEPEEEARPGKRKKNKKNNAEERIKMKRTVFVGNLPASCTKKVLQSVCGSIISSRLFSDLTLSPLVLQNILSLFKQAGTIESVRFRSVVRVRL